MTIAVDILDCKAAVAAILAREELPPVTGIELMHKESLDFVLTTCCAAIIQDHIRRIAPNIEEALSGLEAICNDMRDNLIRKYSR